ncbi:MAG: hypothetical protein ACAI44_13695 [Candidatus Sericytochromatia bacterium]
MRLTKTLLTAMLSTCLGYGLLQPAVWAEPGKEIGPTQRWLTSHPLFPAENFFILPGDQTAVGSYRPLIKGRELVLTVHYDTRLAGMKSKVLYERLSVFHERLPSQTPCREALIQGTTEVRLLATSGEESLNQLWPACLMHTNVNFLHRDAASTLKALVTAYGPKAPLIEDFLNAAPMAEGFQYLTPEWDEQLEALVFAPLKAGPIEQVLFEGQKFDYLVTTNTLTIVAKDHKGYWNDWSLLKQAWDEQLAMYDSQASHKQAAMVR